MYSTYRVLHTYYSIVVYYASYNLENCNFFGGDLPSKFEINILVLLSSQQSNHSWTFFSIHDTITWCRHFRARLNFLHNNYTQIRKSYNEDLKRRNSMSLKNGISMTILKRRGILYQRFLILVTNKLETRFSECGFQTPFVHKIEFIY